MDGGIGNRPCGTIRYPHHPIIVVYCAPYYYKRAGQPPPASGGSRLFHPLSPAAHPSLFIHPSHRHSSGTAVVLVHLTVLVRVRSTTRAENTLT